MAVTRTFSIEPVSVSSNRVSGIEIGILKIRDQRLARRICRPAPNSWTFPLQRPIGLALTPGSVALFMTSRKCPTETTVGGWGARTRTWEWRNQNPLPYHLATPQQ